MTQAVATGTDTTITIPNGATGVARNMYLELTGTGGASTNLIVPANKKLYFIFNNTSSGQVTVKVSGQTGVSVPNGKKMVLVSNGTDIVTAENYVASLSTDNLSLTGNLTLSGGTANGVLYLNGSKVATSGSALVFDGTNLALTTANSIYRVPTAGGYLFDAGGNNGIYILGSSNYVAAYTGGTEQMRLTSTGLGIGTTSPSAKLEAYRNSIGEVARFTASADGFRGLKFVSSDNTGSGAVWTRDIDSAYAQHRWAKSGTPLMVLDESGNLGIGTSSPGYKVTAVVTSGSDSFFADANNQSYSGYRIRAGVGGQQWAFRGGTSTMSLTDVTAGADRLVIDTSGNLGIGTTGTSNGRVNIQAGTAASGNSAFFQNLDGTNNPYLQIQHSANGTKLFGSSSAGGAASNLTLSTPGGDLLLNSSGNVGVGTTVPSTKLDVRSGYITSGTAGSNLGTRVLAGFYTDGALSCWGTEYSSGGPVMGYAVWPSTLAADSFVSASGITIERGAYTISANNHRWYIGASQTVSIGSAVSMTQAMTLTAAGNLLLGGTSTTQLDGVFGQIIGSSTKSSAGIALETQYGAYMLYTDIDDALIFWDSGANAFRARITSGGDLLVGTTGALVSGASRLRVSATGAAAIDAKTTAAADAVVDEWNSATSGDNTFERFWTEGTATQRGSIDYNRAGGLVRYNTTSDYRAKDVYGLLDDSGETIDALKVYRGKMHGATMERPMLIAHEAQEAAPYAVTGEKDAVNEDGTPKFQQMDTSSLVPLLIAEIQSLRSRVAALEAK